MPVEEAALTGFRGGLAARRNPMEFGEEQWAKLHGFIIEDGGIPRSQWPLQEISGLDDVQSFSVYHGQAETPFLVAIKGDGTVWWREAPGDDVEAGSAELSTAWTALLDEAGSAITVATGVRPLVTVPLEASVLAHCTGGLRPAMMLNSIDIPDAGKVWFVYESDDPATEAERLRGMNLGSSAMWPVDTDTDASPKGQHGCLWSGVVVLGDIEWKADPDQALSSTNKTRYRGSLWLSVPGQALRFDPLSVVHIEDDRTVRISGLLPTEQGLLVFTTTSSGHGGVHILRGTPDAYTREPLHVGIGVTEGQAIWQDTNTYCWVTESGEVWQSDTDRVRRLDRQGLGVDRQRSVRDGVAAFGPWLIAVRENRMFPLRALDDGRTAAWSELNISTLPGPPDARWARETGQSFYFLAGNRLYRFTRADLRTGNSERGRTPSGLVDLSIGSRTLSTGEGHDKTFWHRVGVRATSGYRGSSSTVERIILRAGPVLDELAPSIVRHGPWSLESPNPSLDEEDTETPAVEASEDWTCSNHATSIDCDQDWVAIDSSAFELSGGKALSDASGDNAAYMNFELSSDAQYVKASVTGAAADHYVFVRNAGAGQRTFYRFVQTADRRAIERVSGGSVTTLTSATTGLVPPFEMELRVSGSTLTAYIDGEQVLRAIDPHITTGRYVGIGANGTAKEFDSAEAGVLIPSNYMLWDGVKIQWGGVQALWDTTESNELPAPTVIPKRWQAIVRGIGSSIEFSAEAVFRGDVQPEQLSVFFQRGIRGGNEEGR